MSLAAVNEFLGRALLDEEFRRTFEADPEPVLNDYDLTEDERSVVLSRDLAMAKRLFPGVLYCTIRFAMTNENIIALQPFPDEATRVELLRRGDEILGIEGDRTAAIKELLALMR